MAKIKYFDYEGRHPQWLYWCEGCGYEHAFGKENHQFNDDLNNPTISPSLLNNFTPGKSCHSFIKDGKIQYLNDCWHHLAGQTIELPDIDKIFEERAKSLQSSTK